MIRRVCGNTPVAGERAPSRGNSGRAPRVARVARGECRGKSPADGGRRAGCGTTRNASIARTASRQPCVSTTPSASIAMTGDSPAWLGCREGRGSSCCVRRARVVCDSWKILSEKSCLLFASCDLGPTTPSADEKLHCFMTYPDDHRLCRGSPSSAFTHRRILVLNLPVSGTMEDRYSRYSSRRPISAGVLGLDETREFPGLREVIEPNPSKIVATPRSEIPFLAKSPLLVVP